MARYDERTERNWMTKKEKLIRNSTNYLLIATLLDLLSLVLKPVRDYHFENFPNLHFIGILLLFVNVIIRKVQASNEGKDPLMEASREWRSKHDMLGYYDFVGPGSDFSNRKYNLLYYVGVIVSLGLITMEIFRRYS